MGKANPKPSAVNLGTKRTCPKCSTKFYDFNKEEIQCPKCRHELDLAALQSPKFPVEPAAKPKPIEKLIPEASDEVAGDDAFESLDELEGEDDDEVVDDLDVKDKEEEDDSY